MTIWRRITAHAYMEFGMKSPSNIRSHWSRGVEDSTQVYYHSDIAKYMRIGLDKSYEKHKLWLYLLIISVIQK